MNPTGSQGRPSWKWPEDILSSQSVNNSDSRTGETTDSSEPSDRPHKHYPPHTCRICLETVYPTFHPPSEHLPGFLQPAPRVTYESSDPELGRLLRPCKCKGSSRYVHEGCLQTWRLADPNFSKRNYWQCPTCGFQYRLKRMTWARYISSTATQIGLTLTILLCTIFLLGFIADPIINLYVDPLDTLLASDIWESSHVLDVPQLSGRPYWIDHFVKGLASLGVLSFVKALLALSPFQWWSLRPSSLVSSGGRTTGRNRVASISWVIILFGVGSFLWAVYKGVRHWSRSALEKAGARVMDVPLADDDDEEVDFSQDDKDK